MTLRLLGGSSSGGSGGPPTGAAGGDLSGTYPNPTVATVNAVAVSTVTSGAALGATSAQKSANLSDLASASTARTNLGLGSAAVLASSAVAQTANNLSDLASASTARTNLGLGSVATLASSAVGQLAVAQSWSASQTFIGSAVPWGATFGDNDSGGTPSTRQFSLSPRIGTPGLGTFSFPVPTLRATTATTNTALDIMPNGAATNSGNNGICWIDVCNADCYASSSAPVGTVRMSAYSSFGIVSTEAFNGATAMDLWIGANLLSNSTAPQIFISGTTGLMSIFSKTQNANTMLTVVAPGTTYVPIAAVGLTSQTADVFTCHIGGVGGTRVFSISSGGIPKWGNSNGQTTVGAAGAASALPATPSRYLKVTGDDGTSYVIPAYLPV